MSLFPNLVREKSVKVEKVKQLNLFDLLKDTVAPTRVVHDKPLPELDWDTVAYEKPEGMRFCREFKAAKIFIDESQSTIAVFTDGRYFVAFYGDLEPGLIEQDWHFLRAESFITNQWQEVIDWMEDDASGVEIGEILEFDGLKIRLTSSGAELI